MKDKEHPKLLVNKTEASEKIRNRINIGKELHKMQISSEQELTDCQHARKKWVDYNQLLFNTLFQNSPLSKSHGYGLAVFVRSSSDNFFQKDINELKEAIGDGINELESIYEQLNLYEKTTPIREKLHQAKTIVITKITKVWTIL